jgi:predicted DNA-binding transcriptional regulator AlpA
MSAELGNSLGKNGGNGGRLIIPLKEAATMLSMCRQTLMEHVKRGDLPCVRLAANAVYFRPGDLEKFVESRLTEYSPTRIPV